MVGSRLQLNLRRGVAANAAIDAESLEALGRRGKPLDDAILEGGKQIDCPCEDRRLLTVVREQLHDPLAAHPDFQLETALGELSLHPFPADLVQLVEDQQERAGPRGRHAGLGGDGCQQPAIVQAHVHGRHADGGQGRQCRLEDLALGEHGCFADGVDVALGELAVAPPLGSFRPPDRPDLHRPERRRESALVVGVETRQWNGEVISEPEIGEVGEVRLLGHHGIEATPQHSVDELLVVAPLAPFEAGDVLEGGGFYAAVPEPGIAVRQPADDGLALCDRIGEQVAVRGEAPSPSSPPA